MNELVKNLIEKYKGHLNKLFEMLKSQTAIEFKGGLETSRINTEIAERLRGLRIKTLWLACDTDGALRGLKKAVDILKKAGFNRNHLHCYALIGDDINKNEIRLRQIWDIGCMPFAQLYQPIEKIKYSDEFKRFVRNWSRPAIIRAREG